MSRYVFLLALLLLGVHAEAFTVSRSDDLVSSRRHYDLWPPSSAAGASSRLRTHFHRTLCNSRPNVSPLIKRRQAATSPTKLLALLDPSIVLTQQSIHDAFSVATFFPQPFWLLLIVIPNTSFTKRIMGGMEVVTLCCLVHLFIVVASIAQQGGSAPIVEFADVFDPAGDPQKAFIGMMQYPNFVTEEWSHVLTWDLFVGRWIWLDGLRRDIFTRHSVLLCNLIGPPGLLLHWATCLVTGKGIVGNPVLPNDSNDDAD